MSATLEGVVPALGIHENVDSDTYHAWQAASNTWFRHLRRSPAHLKAFLISGDKDTDALRMGRAVHAAVLEPDTFEKRWGCAPELDRRTTAGKKAWEVLESHFGAGMVLKPDEHARVSRMRDSVVGHYSARNLLRAPGKSELSLVWEDVETGVLCKARLDRYAELDGGTIVDLKKTTDASQRSFEKTIYKYAYQVQAAHYIRGAKACGLDVNHFVHIAVEDYLPYAVAAYRMTDAAIDAGTQEVESLLQRYAECQASGNWPAYSEGIEDVTLPSYAWSQIEEDTPSETV